MQVLVTEALCMYALGIDAFSMDAPGMDAGTSALRILLWGNGVLSEQRAAVPSYPCARRFQGWEG